MDYEALKFWFGVMQALALAGLWLYTWNVNRNRATAEEIREVKTTLASHDGRLAVLEQRLDDLPGLEHLEKSVEELTRGVAELKGTVVQMTGQLTIIQQHLLQRAS